MEDRLLCHCFPVSPILLVPVTSSLPSEMLWAFLAGNGRTSYTSVQKTGQHSWCSSTTSSITFHAQA